VPEIVFHGGDEEWYFSPATHLQKDLVDLFISAGST
jgi:hypothetical protein